MARSMLRYTVSSRRPATVSPLPVHVGRRYRTSHAWDSALSRSLRFALEALLVVRPGGGTLTLE